MSRLGIVIVGGAPPPPAVHSVLPADPALVIAADSGFDHALGLGLRVDVLVGDLDSISAGGRQLAENDDDVTIERHRPDKDFTDTELAVAIAMERGVDHLLGITGGGDRLDHQLGTLAAFAKAAAGGIRVEVWWSGDHVDILHGPAQLGIDARVGALVSLIAIGGSATDVSTDGLRYPLHGAALRPDVALGVSNVVDSANASVSVATGTLLVITPGVLA